MTNAEILQSDALDILFENRNKSYGAYALRRNYNNRLKSSMGATLSVVLILIFISMNSKKDNNDPGPLNKETFVTVEMRQDKPKDPEIIKEKTKPAEKFAQIKATAKIDIVRDDQIPKTDVPVVSDMADKVISNINTDGDIPKDPNARINSVPVENGDGNKKSTEPPVVDNFKKYEKDAEFPGGRQALMRFFGLTLNTPEDLEAGEKKIILVRFMVDVDGAISKIEIVQSGGDKYDREVIRAIRKMPRWSPAIQNGRAVGVYFTQPVTFVGVEQ